MSTDQLQSLSTAAEPAPPLPPRNGRPHADCRATKEELRDSGLRVIDYCPICADVNVSCRVGFHPSSITQGN